MDVADEFHKRIGFQIEQGNAELMAYQLLSITTSQTTLRYCLKKESSFSAKGMHTDRKHRATFVFQRILVYSHQQRAFSVCGR